MEQITLFSGSSEIRIDKKIRLIELFAGIGSQAKALKNIGADFEHYRICEFDKYAVTSYNAIHGTDFKVSDITKWHAADLGIIEKDKYEYIVTYSFPCQSLSVAGKGEGMAKGSGTRSGLLWEVERLLEECGDNLPQILLMENVDAILFEKNRKHFFQWCNRLEEFGYRNYYQVLNAKDYGIPQNRKRCYMVSILGDYYYEFPKPIKLELRVKDRLEDEVPEKYYISIDKVNELINKDHQGVKGTLPYGDNEEMVTNALSSREHRTGGR
ncbi:MAG TPA: DNA (cytosine-5-)-methyltransferase, partial [Petrotogaceae bacterium]|nr:DNA (cytosine-5-)-methyltransferase [Petrotogaceae bacterium]